MFQKLRYHRRLSIDWGICLGEHNVIRSKNIGFTWREFIDSKFKICKMNIVVIVCIRQFQWIDILCDNRVKMFIFNLIDTNRK